ncbi:MAG: cation diffusion facilitator family transporter [bacterium]
MTESTPPKKQALGPVTLRLVRRMAGVEDAELDRAGRSVAYALVEGYLSVVINLALFAIKLTLGLLTGSISLIADAVHTASDSLTSVVVVVSAYIARKPPDREHPYGHGRIEYVATVVIAVLLGVAGLEFGKESILRILNPRPISASWIVITVVLATAVVKEWLARYAIKLSQLSGNRSLTADAWHHRSDAIATVLVALGMIATILGWPIFDGIAGVGVSLLLFKVAYEIARDAVDSLLGQAPTPEEIAQVKVRARSVEGVHGVHDVVIHRYGSNVFISLHVETSAEPSAIDLHRIAAEVEERVAAGGHGSVCVHVDPVDRDHPAYDTVCRLVAELVAGDPDLTSFHDLRLVGGAEEFNVVLDLVISPDCRDFPAIQGRVEQAIRAHYPAAQVVIEVEPTYSY